LKKVSKHVTPGIEDFSKGITLDVTNIECHIRRGQAKQYLGNITEAKKDFDLAVKYNENQESIKFEAYYQRGIYYFNNGDYKSSIIDFQKVLQITEFVDVYNYLGIALDNIGHCLKVHFILIQ
jgi:tetratricopeptide (TPR) repeat protein